MPAIHKKVRNKLTFFWDDLSWRVREKEFLSVIPFTIGITTFMDRYQDCLKPLLKKMCTVFPETDIIVIANGHYKEIQQGKYIKDIASFTGRYNNVKLISLTEPSSLSFLWNQLIRESKTSSVLIMNDDLVIGWGFRSFIATSDILNTQISTINNSWSHFLISKKIIDKIGFFDERLRELGGEDDDFLARLAIEGIFPDSYQTDTIRKRKPWRSRSKVNSFGKVITEQAGGYSTLNTTYLQSKWQTSDKPFDGAVEVRGRVMRYWKLRLNK